MPQTTHERPSTHTLSDDAIARRAHIRAIAAGLVDGPRMGRRFHVPEGVPLHPSSRRRRHGHAVRTTVERRRGPARRRLVGLAVLVAQVGVLVAVLAGPQFRVRTVDVTGDRLLSRTAVLAAAGVPHSSLFTLDGAAIESRLTRLAWVRSATVTTDLPSTVLISVTEWQPDVLLRRAARTTVVAGNGATLPLVAGRTIPGLSVPLLLDNRAGTQQQALVPGLADLLSSAAQRWQSLYGCSLDAFVLSSSNVLSAWCSAGWQAVFGTLDSVDAVAALPQQLAVLAALNGRLDLAHPSFGYVDLENPADPTVGGKPGEPAAIRSEIAGSAAAPAPAATYAPVGPSASAAASPSAVPSPTPRPTPSPLVFQLTPPSPSAHR